MELMIKEGSAGPCRALGEVAQEMRFEDFLRRPAACRRGGYEERVGKIEGEGKRKTEQTKERVNE